MSSPSITPYGEWRSPITADLIVAGGVSLGGLKAAGQNLYWLEGRPQQKGRTVLIQRQPDGRQQDLTPPPFNVRSRVHEYGGGAYEVTPQQVFFSNFADNRIYTLWPTPEPLTQDSSQRFSDFCWDAQGDRLIAVCEEHDPSGQEPRNFLAAIDLKNGAVTPLVQGSDFYSSPRLSPNGRQLVWMSWQHPHLPWQQTQLWLADLEATGELTHQRCIAGGQGPEALNEPRWSPAGDLYFVGEHQGWWNLFVHRDGQRQLVYPLPAEFTAPHWVFGLSSYVFVGEDIFCTYNQDGCWYLAQLDPTTSSLRTLELAYTNFSDLTSEGNHLYCLAGSTYQSTLVLAIGCQTLTTTVLKESNSVPVDQAYFSSPQALTFPTAGGLEAHGWYYPPHNPDYQAPCGSLPPLLVKSHGGPTAQASNALNLKIQYWTSRGFGYLDVNYGGSTGYGRAYRQRLAGQWGVVDVEDCLAGAQYLVDQGLVNPFNLAITGGSAGGYTTLAALTFHKLFKAGASHYGVGDLAALATDTHKFECHYLDWLIGPYPLAQELYQRRSPLFHAHQLNCPVIFFQGLQDKVVPPHQAEAMAAALKNKGIPVAYVVFPEEGHGFRQAANIKRALEEEFYFYAQVFNFKPAS